MRFHSGLAVSMLMKVVVVVVVVIVSGSGYFSLHAVTVQSCVECLGCKI